MKGFFPDKEKTQAFFIVTDGQQKPYVLWQEDSPILNDFTDKLKADTFKSLIDFLKGKTCNTGNTTETTAEFIFDKDEKQWKNIYTNEVIKLDFLPQNTEWLYLIRISKLKDGKNGNCIFETQGLLGFYSQNTMEQYLPKQLLMLLRKDISAFINKHHKNDEFSELIQQKEKNKYVFRLNHGVSTYEDAIESILENCNDVNLKDDLETFYEYLITKLDIIDKLSSKTPPKEVSLQTIKDEFENKYEKVLSLNVASINGIAKNDIQALVKLNNFTGFSNLDEKYYFPENSIKDVVFELLNNIRKNVCNANKWQITADNPLRINVTVINEGGNKYLSVTNNHVRDLDPQHSKKEDVPHGLDLLRQMWSTHKLGKIITPDYPLKEYSFTIKIQLKKYEEDNNH